MRPRKYVRTCRWSVRWSSWRETASFCKKQKPVVIDIITLSANAKTLSQISLFSSHPILGVKQGTSSKTLLSIGIPCDSGTPSSSATRHVFGTTFNPDPPRPAINYSSPFHARTRDDTPFCTSSDGERRRKMEQKTGSPLRQPSPPSTQGALSTADSGGLRSGKGTRRPLSRRSPIPRQTSPSSTRGAVLPPESGGSRSRRGSLRG